MKERIWARGCLEGFFWCSFFFRLPSSRGSRCDKEAVAVESLCLDIPDDLPLAGLKPLSLAHLNRRSLVLMVVVVMEEGVHDRCEVYLIAAVLEGGVCNHVEILHRGTASEVELVKLTIKMIERKEYDQFQLFLVSVWVGKERVGYLEILYADVIPNSVYVESWLFLLAVVFLGDGYLVVMSLDPGVVVAALILCYRW